MGPRCRLLYTRFAAQGGDLGAVITDVIGLPAPPELVGIHVNMPDAIPTDINQAAFSAAPAPDGLTAEERASYDQLVFFYQHVYYAFWMGIWRKKSPYNRALTTQLRLGRIVLRLGRF